MLPAFAHRAERWLKQLVFEWSLRTRLLVALLLAGIAMFGLMTIFGEVTGSLSAGQPVDAWLARPAFYVVLSFVILTGVMLAMAGSLARSITDIAARVEQQLASGDLDIAVKPSHERKDEIGRLISALNSLGQAYRASLQNLARQTDERAVLDLLAATINRTLDLQEVLDTSLRGTLKAVKWDMGAIYMWDDRNDSLNMVSYIGFSEDMVRQNISHQLGDGLIGGSAQERTLQIDNAVEQPAGGSSTIAGGVPAVRISIPLVTVPGQLLGVMEVGSSVPKVPTQNELNLLKTVASHISLAIDKAQLYTKASQHAVELEKVVAARTEQLSQAIDELWVALKHAEEADRVKSLLLSTVSHELRTPLATIKGNTSLLLQHHDRIPSEQFIDHLRDIDEETDKLTELISSLLEMSRIEAGMLHIQSQSIDLVDVLRGAVDAARLRLRNHTLELSCRARSITAYGDARRIEQVVANLVDNAAKYSPVGTPIAVRVAKRDKEVIVSVKDRGKGIEPEYLERIFERFYQIGNSRDSGRHGIGLGLAICRGLIEAQGGRIWVESRVGQGSTFYFSLPIVSGDSLWEET